MLSDGIEKGENTNTRKASTTTNSLMINHTNPPRVSSMRAGRAAGGGFYDELTREYIVAMNWKDAETDEWLRAGRAAFRSGAMQPQDSAQPSTPVMGTPFWHHE